MSWDPRDDGADCDQCVLRELRMGEPVRAELKSSAYFIVVGDYPGSSEIETGRPMTGEAGQRLDATLAAVGVYRQSYALTNALACAPDKIDKVMRELTKRNKERVEANKERKRKGLPVLQPLPSPFACCRPRLMKDIKGYKNRLACGKNAAAALLDEEVSITDVRGGPIEQEGGVKVLPTFNPAYVNRKPSERFAFEADCGRAARWFRTGKLGWKQPQMVYRASYAEVLVWWAKAKGSSITFDIETLPHPDRIHLGVKRQYDALYDQLGLLGLYSRKAGYGISLPFRSKVDPALHFYNDVEREKLRRLVFLIFQDQKTQKRGWNSGYYDLIVLERFLWDLLDALRPMVIA